MTAASKHLRDANQAEWRGLIDHEFFRQVEQGILPRHARDAYFLNERAFVDQAVTIFACILTKAPDAVARRHLVGVLNGLVADQPALVDDILSRAGLTAGPPERTQLSMAARALCDGMTEIARDGAYAEGIAAMFVAERSYEDVAQRIVDAGRAALDLHAWFDLHTQSEFTNGVRWLESELDRLPADGDGDVANAFCRAIDLEVAFHSSPLYSAPGARPGFPSSDP